MKIAIVGGGIIGKLLAFFLAKAGFHITLFEKKETSCSRIAAGLLSAISELDKTDRFIYELGKLSLQLWPNILSDLDEDIYFQHTGSYLLAHSRDLPELHRTIECISKKLPEKKLSKIFAGQFSSAFREGYFLEDDGQIDSQAVLQALNNFLIQKKVNIIREKVLKISPNQIFLESKVKHFDWVCDCRGLGAKDNFATLRGIRGELMWLRAPFVKIDKPVRILHPRYHLYLAPRPNDIYIVGASEIESEEMSEISVRTALELLTVCFSLHPGFSEARILKTETHCRPALSMHLPKIIYSDGFIAVNGLYRYGFLISPILALEISQYISENISPEFSQIWCPYVENNIESKRNRVT